MFFVLGLEAHTLVRSWGGQDLVDLPYNRHTMLSFDGAPVVAFRLRSLGQDVPCWSFLVDEAAASEFWRKASLKVSFE
jgi:hypothetical protein